MWTNTELIMDKNFVDIKDIKKKFCCAFNPIDHHDAYKFLVHFMNGVTNETVDINII